MYVRPVVGKLGAHGRNRSICLKARVALRALSKRNLACPDISSSPDGRRPKHMTPTVPCCRTMPQLSFMRNPLSRICENGRLQRRSDHNREKRIARESSVNTVFASLQVNSYKMLIECGHCA